MAELSIFSDTNESMTNATLSHPEESDVIYSYGERVFVASCYVAIVIFGVFGNSFVIVAVMVSLKLRTDTNIFVVNLVIANLLTSRFLTWSIVALLGRDGWPLPGAEWLCVIGGFMIYACTGTSLWNLAAIALNKLFLIILPISSYRKIYKPSSLALMVTFVWFFPFCMCLALPLAGIGGFGYDQQHSTCSDLDHHPRGETFHLAQTITFYPIPLITIITCYAFIFRRMKYHFKQQRNNEKMNAIAPSRSTPTVSSNVITTGSTSGQSSNQDAEAPESTAIPSNRTHRINKMEMDINRNLFLVVCMFFLFFPPYSIALFIPGSDYFLLYGGIIVLANSAVNPIIYSWRHPHFKIVFSCMINGKLDDIPEPSASLKRFLRQR